LRDEALSKVKELLRLEGGMYETLRKMVSREMEAIVLNGDMEELLSILQEKQEVISSLQLLTDGWADAVSFLEFEEPRGTASFWEKLSALFSGEESGEFNQILSETRLAAENLIQAEERVQIELEKHARQLRGEMLRMKQGRSAVIGYAKMGGGRLDLS